MKSAGLRRCTRITIVLCPVATNPRMIRAGQTSYREAGCVLGCAVFDVPTGEIFNAAGDDLKTHGWLSLDK